MRVILVLIICIVIGYFGLRYLQEHHHVEAPSAATTREEVSTSASSLADKTRAAASNAKDVIADKMKEWHLTPSDIRADLQQGGDIIRTKSQSAGSSLAQHASNAKVVTVIKTKFALDKDLSARAIQVTANEGKVVLAGNVGSEELIGRAVSLALDTDGVTEVKSQLKVAAP